MSRLQRAPANAGRFVWQFINPSRTAGRVPLGRLTIVIQLIAALIFVGYTMSKKSLRLPFSEARYEIQAVFPDARGLDRLDDPGAAVAGTPLGRVTEAHYEDGRAVATLTLEPDVRGKVFNDASATIRPGSAIQNLVVNVDPGTPESGPLEDGGRIEAQNTTAFVAIDDLTSTLDADTRAYVQILVSEAQRALHGSESELKSGLDQLGELTETAAPVARSLARRRTLLTRLVGELDEVATTLGDRQSQLAQVIAAGNRTLEVTATRDAELAEATRRLGPTLLAARGALRAVNGLTEPLEPALAQLAPSIPELTAGLAATRTLLPRVDALTDTFKGLIEDGTHPLELMVEGTRGLRGRLAKQVPIAESLTALSRRLDRYKGGVAQLADTLSGALSVNDRGGTYGQVNVIGTEDLKPENFGFGPAAARSSGGRPSLLEKGVAEALTQACIKGSPEACLTRLSVPGLPKVSEQAAGGGG